MESQEMIYRAGMLPRDWSQAVLLIDKPVGWTSFDVIRKLKRYRRKTKIGHAGTLDPMATGLLIVLVGKATKQMEGYQVLEKTYDGVMRLGETTPSYDAETPVDTRVEAAHIAEAQVAAACVPFTGAVQQLPPMYSAVKVGGERLYRKARRGESVERKPRTVTVQEFSVTGMTGSNVSFCVRCSKGTYVRTLAHDVGQALGVGAHLIALRRTAIGPYSVAQAWDMPALAEALEGQAAS